MNDERRFNRNELLFGKHGQEKLGKTRVAIVGLGGTGSHLVQQLAYLGIRDFTLVDRDVVTSSSMNRLIGAFANDVQNKTAKVQIAKRHILQIRNDANVQVIEDSVISDQGFDAVKQSDYVFGCVDRDGVRLILTELCAAYERPYFDVATDIHPNEHLMFGGRVVFSRGNLCLMCTGNLDQDEIRRDLSSPEQRKEDDRLYGISRDVLRDEGPSVVSVNGILASLCVTEFMVAVTNLRKPKEHLTYYGMGSWDGRVTSKDSPDFADCYYCNGLTGQGDAVDVNRYIREGIGGYL